jgi:hypothetical protein
MDLNLLPSRAKFQAVKIKLKNNIILFVWIFVFTWVSLLTVVFAIFFVVNFNLSTSQKKYVSQQNQYKGLAEDVSISYQIKYRAKLVGKVLKDRFEYGSTIKKIYEIFSSNISIVSYEIKGPKLFSVSGNVAEGKNMDEVEQKVVEINRGISSYFASAKLTSVVIDTDGGWNFTMEFNLK